jgi:nucleotide-binding universal stress UspA family protein
MSFRTILVPVGEERGGEACLHAARVLAWRFDAVLIGMHVVLPPPVAITLPGDAAVYAGPQLLEAYRSAAAEERARLKQTFRRICGSDATAVWSEAEGDPAQILAEAAHTVDLVVVSKRGGGDTERHALVEHLAMAAGVPVLMLPERGAGEPGKVVIAGWNGSREASRAVHDALPFLTAAERVVLCAIGAEAIATLEPAAAMLRRNGVPVQAEPIPEPEQDVGETLLSQAAAHGADLLVAGAYGHSRLRELVFGGVTRHLLQAATLPVLFSS